MSELKCCVCLKDVDVVLSEGCCANCLQQSRIKRMSLKFYRNQYSGSSGWGFKDAEADRESAFKEGNRNTRKMEPLMKSKATCDESYLSLLSPETREALSSYRLQNKATDSGLNEVER